MRPDTTSILIFRWPSEEEKFTLKVEMGKCLDFSGSLKALDIENKTLFLACRKTSLFRPAVSYPI